MAKTGIVARDEPTTPAKLLNRKKLKLAERVGFVPAIPAPINNWARFQTLKTPEYQVQNRYSRYDDFRPRRMA